MHTGADNAQQDVWTKPIRSSRHCITGVCFFSAVSRYFLFVKHTKIIWLYVLLWYAEAKAFTSKPASCPHFIGPEVSNRQIQTFWVLTHCNGSGNSQSNFMCCKSSHMTPLNQLNLWIQITTLAVVEWETHTRGRYRVYMVHYIVSLPLCSGVRMFGEVVCTHSLFPTMHHEK